MIMPNIMIDDWVVDDNDDCVDSARFESPQANFNLTNAKILFWFPINFFNQYLLQLRLYENAETFHCIKYSKRF